MRGIRVVRVLLRVGVGGGRRMGLRMRVCAVRAALDDGRRWMR